LGKDLSTAAANLDILYSEILTPYAIINGFNDCVLLLANLLRILISLWDVLPGYQSSRIRANAVGQQSALYQQSQLTNQNSFCEDQVF
jgi:hypothetical protein